MLVKGLFDASVLITPLFERSGRIRHHADGYSQSVLAKQRLRFLSANEKEEAKLYCNYHARELSLVLAHPRASLDPFMY